MKLARPASALAAVAVLAAGCGTTTSATSSPGATQTANVLVCQHYSVQRAWVKHLAMPTLSDALKFAGYVAADSAEAQPGTPLARDLDTMTADEQHLKSSYAASARVVADCEALGITFTAG